MKNLLVSVVIPNYNHARFLDERIRSVLNQTYQNFELILLDDKSTDNSVEIINKYKDNPHVSHIVVNEENSGSTFNQWHKGFELAKGEIIWIAESDDSCDNTLLETLARGMVREDVVLAFCRSCKYDVSGMKSFYAHQAVLTSDILMSGKEFISKYMIEINCIANASAAIFNRRVAMTIDERYKTMKAEGDWLFWIELMEQGNVFFCSEEHNYFRFHDLNTTKIQIAKGTSALEHKVVFDYLVRHGYLTGLQKKLEQLRLLDYWVKTEFDNKRIKRNVLSIWDANRMGRLHLMCSHIKESIKLFFLLF